MTEKAEIIELYKNLGETPLECLLRFKAEHPEYEREKMTYLGRLDPMAEGLLLALVGNMKDKDKYLSYDKSYDFEVLWGFATDTHDSLGLVSSIGQQPQRLESKIAGLIQKIKAKKTQAYPLFSSKGFGGDFLKARSAKIEELERPEKQIKIFDLAHLNTRLISQKELMIEIERRVGLVKGDFRQKEILKSWRAALGDDKSAMISSFRADVSSGTYIRGLAHEMGEVLGTGAIAWSIKRTRVGEYKI